MKTRIRRVKKEDLPALKKVIISSELFPAELLDDMISDYLHHPDSQEIWLTMDDNNGVPLSIAYCAPEKMTECTYNLYLIAITKEHQGSGIGSEIMEYLEDKLKSMEARVLIVETSGLPEFELTRKFYDKSGYTREATIREFYAPGEDKIVFCKKLANL